MSNLKVKHWKGWITNRIIDHDETRMIWLDKIQEAKQKETQLVVFEVPNNLKGTNAIHFIEQELQIRFK